MPPNTPKKPALALSAAPNRAELESPTGRKALTDGLSSQQTALVVQAAKLIADHTLDGFDAALSTAYRRLTGDKAARLDPGCAAKVGLLVALEAIQSLDAELFAEDALYVQLERAKGGDRDSAAGVRAHALLGLARLGHPDSAILFGAGLADRDRTVRLSAARAISHRGHREGAGLLLLRLGVGDESPEVLMECMRGLWALAPELGLRHARAELSGPMREQLLHALGTAPSDRAIEMLADELANTSLTSERQPVIQALGLSVRPSARALLLELVGGERASDAEAAISALAIHRYDTRLRAQLTELTVHAPELARRVAALFT